MEYTTTALEERIRAAKKWSTPNLEGVKNIILNIVNMPFADYMFFDLGAYQMIMQQICQQVTKNNCPDMTVGEVCEFIAEQQNLSAGNKCTQQMIRNMQKPYNKAYEFVNGRKVNNLNIMKEVSPWDFVKEKSPYPPHGAAEQIPLDLRVEKVRNSRAFKKKQYENYAAKGLIPSQYGRNWIQYLIGLQLKDICTASAELTHKDKNDFGVGKLCEKYSVKDTLYIMDLCDVYLSEMTVLDIFRLFVEQFAEISKANENRKRKGKGKRK